MTNKTNKPPAGTNQQKAETKDQPEAYRTGKNETSSAQALPLSFIEECLNANYLGDGALFAALHRGRFIFDETVGESSRADIRPWLKWTGQYYEEDLMGEVYQAVEDLIPFYLELLNKKEKELQELVGKE